MPWLVDGEGAIDVQSVVTHEFGHIAGLGHADTYGSCGAGACVHVDPARPLTMYSASRPGDIMHRTLGLGELLYLARRGA